MTPGTPRVLRHPLETLKLKPRTTVKRFAAELKFRIARIEARHARSADPKWLDGVTFIKSALADLLAEFDVRDPEDYPGGRTPSAATAEPVKPPECSCHLVEGGFDSWCPIHGNDGSARTQAAPRDCTVQSCGRHVGDCPHGTRP